MLEAASKSSRSELVANGEQLRNPCIYCKTRQADSDEHYLPEFLGKFSYEPLVLRVCTKCNNTIGDIAEREMSRGGPEGVNRFRHAMSPRRRGGRKKKPQQSPFRTGELRHLAKDPDTGYTVLWQPGDHKGAVKVASQLIAIDANGHQQEPILIPPSVTTGAELLALLARNGDPAIVPKWQAIAAKGDETRLRAIFAELGWSRDLQPRVGGRLSSPSIYMGTIGLGYFRALAKIGFHYALKFIPTLVGDEEEFKPVRDFILSGVGRCGDFVAVCGPALDSPEQPAHILAAVARPDDGVFAYLKFFNGSEIATEQYRINLGKNPTRLYEFQSSRHAFLLGAGADGRLRGDKVIELPLNPIQFTY